ncbi:MAG TPA: nuclear transport factor 2 family protein [Thermoleophilaceae bacterium]|nr:nuclear transport factor 2 family protein [Thermoleophilaceae bacterium]
MGSQNVETVRRVFDAFTRRDLDALQELLDESVLFEPAPTHARPHRSYLGHSGMRQYFEDVASTWDRLEVHVQEYRHAGSYVLAFGRIYAAGAGSVADDPASFVWRLEGGKVVWGKVFRRRDEALDVVGLSE